MPWEEHQYIPYHTTDLTGHTVLVLAPHPDDETFGCGGAILLHRQHQDPVKVVILTDGAAADVEGTQNRTAYIARREAEARTACQRLGTTDLTCWRIPDRTLAADAPTVERLVALLDAYRPTLIYAPSPLEYHPDHAAAAHLLWQALQSYSGPAQVAFYEIYTPLRVNTLVDISRVQEQKAYASTAYESQLARIPYTDFALALNRYRALTVSDHCTHAEGYVVLPLAHLQSQPIENFPGIPHPPLPPESDLVPRQTPPIGYSGAHPPLVSVIIRTRDRPALLRQALQSVADQTYPNLEVLVVNDAGEDVQPVVEAFAESLQVRLFTHAEHQGRSAAANTGLRAARGKYVNFLDDDDLFYAGHIAKGVGILESTHAALAYSDCERARYSWQEGSYRPHEPPSLYKGVDFDRDRLFAENYIPIMTALFRRGLVETVGLFDERLEVFEDWDYWIRIAEQSTLHRVAGVTALYRMPAQQTYDYVRGKQVIFQKHSALCTLENTLLQLDATQARAETLQGQLETLQGQLETLQAEHQRLLRTTDQLLAEIKRLHDEEHRLHLALERLQTRFPNNLVRWIRSYRA